MLPSGTPSDTVDSRIPRLGDLVLYSLEYGPSMGQARPAVIVRVVGGYVVNIQVFTDEDSDGRMYDTGIVYRKHVQHDTHRAPGTWHWSEER